MHQIRYFLSVARTLNFTRAAEQCNVAQPSLTRAIQNLEAELGGLLFHRERANTHLTDLGRMMLPHLERTFLAAEAARDLARGVKSGEMAPLRVGLSSVISSDVLVELFEGLRSCVNGVELTLRQAPERELCEQALAGHHDIVFMTDLQELPEKMRSWVLFREQGRLIMPENHYLARKTEIDIAELDGQDMIDNAGASDRDLLLSICAGAGVSARFRHRVHGTDELQVLVRQGFGLAVLPANVPLIPGIVARPFVNAGIERNVIVAITAGRPFNRATEACLRLARSRAWPARERADGGAYF